MRGFSVLILMVIISACLCGCVSQPQIGQAPARQVPPSVQNTPVAAMTGNGITEDIRIRDSHFDPEIITIRQGTTVRWRNEDPVTHYVVHQAPHTDPQLFSSGAILKGESFSFTFTSAGRYNYADPQRGGGRSYLIIVEP